MWDSALPGVVLSGGGVRTGYNLSCFDEQCARRVVMMHQLLSTPHRVLPALDTIICWRIGVSFEKNDGITTKADHNYHNDLIFFMSGQSLCSVHGISLRL